MWQTKQYFRKIHSRCILRGHFLVVQSLNGFQQDLHPGDEASVLLIFRTKLQPLQLSNTPTILLLLTLLWKQMITLKYLKIMNQQRMILPLKPLKEQPQVQVNFKPKTRKKNKTFHPYYFWIKKNKLTKISIKMLKNKTWF